MPSEGSFAASGPRRHGEPPACRPCGVGARWHQGHSDSCPVLRGRLPGDLLVPAWVLQASSWEPPGGAGAGVLFTGVQLKPLIAGVALGGHLYPLPEHRPTDEAWTFLNVAEARPG